MDATVVFTCNSAWGIFQFRRNVILALLQAGVRVVTVAPYDESTPLLASLGCETVDLQLSPKGINPLADIKLVLSLYRVYKRVQPNFVFHYTVKPNIFGAIAARLAGVRSISFATGLGYAFISETWVSKVVRLLYRFALQFPTEVWFLNDDDLREFVQRRLVDEGSARILPGEGVDTSHFLPDSVRGLVEAEFCFLMIARLLWDKGVAEYVGAARAIRARNPKVRFLLLGALSSENPSAVHSKELAEWVDHGDIEYLGTTSDVRSVLSTVDCVVLPSYREGIPRVLLEAAAMAKPIIATDVPGCRDVVRDGVNGFLCAPRDIASLTAAMDQVLALSPDRRSELGHAGREFVKETYDDSVIVKRYFETLESYRVVKQTDRPNIFVDDEVSSVVG